MRITGGVFRSRPLRTPRGTTTRPTSDRVREALFSILTADRSVEGAKVLDLYAGTGALALEALSRGAAHATLVDANRAALDALRANIDALGVRATTRVLATKVERALADPTLGGPFDLVFADPPYVLVSEGEAARVLAQLAPRLTSDARVVLEHASKSPPPALEGLEGRDTRVYGDTALTFYER
jgi:16S rRNA (guanine966-N2)-methyltransferase